MAKKLAISLPKRQVLYGRLPDAVDTLLTEAGFNKLTRWSLRTFFINGKIKGFLDI